MAMRSITSNESIPSYELQGRQSTHVWLMLMSVHPSWGNGVKKSCKCVVSGFEESLSSGSNWQMLVIIPNGNDMCQKILPDILVIWSQHSSYDNKSSCWSCTISRRQRKENSNDSFVNESVCIGDIYQISFVMILTWHQRFRAPKGRYKGI